MTQPRAAEASIYFIDRYCQNYQEVFAEVRSYEAFKQMLMGIITPSRRKSLSEIAKIVGLEQSQSLHHFITSSPWTERDLRKVRLKIIIEWIEGKGIDIIVDETGDPKKGKKTEYVDRQYLGRLGKVDNGIVTVNIYGVKDGIVFPLTFEVYKPKKRLKAEDSYKSKPEIAAEMVKELVSMGIKINRVIADSLYGESGSNFIRVLEKLGLDYLVAIRENHGVWMPEEPGVTQLEKERSKEQPNKSGQHHERC